MRRSVTTRHSIVLRPPGSHLGLNEGVLRDPNWTSSPTMGRVRIGKTEKTEHELPLMLPVLLGIKHDE